jgi:hypothetical protein
MLPAGFADSQVATGGYAVAWTSLRFSITPLGGPRANQQLRLIGVRKMSGKGMTIEGVNLVWGADGSGQALKITEGRENPDEITIGLDPLTYANVVKPSVRNSVTGRKYLFNFAVQKVDASGTYTSTEVSYQCTMTGASDDTPEGGDPHETQFKFKPTRVS